MYACYQGKTVPGTESFSLFWVISENLLHISTWTVAGMLLWPIWQPAGLPMLTILWALLVAGFQVALKKHNCSGCYYYGKRCHLGWGKISSALFKQDSGSFETGKKLSVFYIISPPLIVLCSIFTAILQPVHHYYWGMLAFYILLNALSFPVRKKGCAVCAMREVCPGSAVAK